VIDRLERWTTTTLFYEYLELSMKSISNVFAYLVILYLVIQYGFVSMFLVAFPRKYFYNKRSKEYFELY